MFLKIVPLFLLILTGSVNAACGLYADREEAIRVLNRYALYVAFPALIIAGLGDRSLAPPTGLGFYTVHVLSFVLVSGLAWGLGSFRRLSLDRGVLVLCTVFGNIAYLGIPVIERFLGGHAAGIAALSAAVHVALAMMFGPLLFLLGSRAAGATGTDAASAQSIGETLMAVLRQPLVWSPVLGLATRLVDGPVVAYWLDLTGVIGRSAGPVALFMLGIYLWEHRRALTGMDRSGVAIVALKLIVYPLVTVGVLWLTRDAFSLTTLERQVVVLMAGMPVAVTTFSITEEFGHGRRAAAAAILVSTFLSAASLPWVATW